MTTQRLGQRSARPDDVSTCATARCLLQCTAFACVLAIALTGAAAAAPLDDVNQYADRCSAELGAGAGSYMPIGMLPRPDDFTGTEEIPVFWNQKRITFTETNAATGVPQAGTGHWEFVFDGQPGAVGFPDGANTIGRIRPANRTALKCDYWSHVNATNDACIAGTRDGLNCDCPASTCNAVTRLCNGGPNAGEACRPANDCAGGGTCTPSIPTGCFPGQRAAQREVGTCSVNNQPCANDAQCGGGAGSCRDIVTWSFVFRRLLPPRLGQATFNASHPYFFNNMDAIAFKADTGGVCWFDTLLTSSLMVDRWWEAAPGLPTGIPRPGGKDTAKKARAAGFWERPDQVMNNANPGERCTTCHGNGPILTSRWINQGDVFKNRVARSIPFWHPAKLLPDPVFKRFNTTALPADECGEGCHRHWSVSASTTPDGGLANAMTADPPAELASFYRRQIDAAGNPFARTCRRGANDGQPCTVAANCPGGTCDAGQNAGILREMPHPFRGTPTDWDNDVRPGYNAMAACLRKCVGGTRAGRLCHNNGECPGGACPVVNNAVCDGTAPATIPAFFGAQSAPPPPLNQRIDPPYAAVDVTFARANCVLAANGSETCDYNARWKDPTAGESDYHAADRYYLVTNTVPNEPARTPATMRFCLSTTVETTASKTPQAGSNWAMNYAAADRLAACTKTEIRLCGGYAIDNPVGANNAHAPVDSRNDGDLQKAVLVTACANPMQVTRSGFRLHRATGRYVQTITLRNGGAAAVIGPVTYLLFNLSANAQLFNGSGATAAIVPIGTPYRNVNVGAGNKIDPGVSVSFQLEFVNPTNKGITYDARVRTGAGAL